MPIDYSKYPPNWKTEIVPRIRKRSGGVCEKCGNMKNGDIVYSISLYVKTIENGYPRYKKKRFWFKEHGDALRANNYFESNIKKVRVVLTVAHLNHDEENHDVKDEDLMDMCQWCHLNYDAKEKYRRVLNR
jgi:rRNA pseudouridine-1189 N-methylase Emg1 (Nep1/Mra1 family)